MDAQASEWVANTQKGPGVMSAAWTTPNAVIAGTRPPQDILDYLGKKNEAILNYHVEIPDEALIRIDEAFTPQKNPAGSNRRRHRNRPANGR
jgi:hypothetical protein